MGLRDYQSRGKGDILQAFDEGHQIVFFVLFTGGGKTVLFTDIIKDTLFQGNKAMLMAHREELIFQAWNKMQAAKIYAGIIKSGEKEAFHLPCQVCSVQTIARRLQLPDVSLVVVDEGHHVTAENSYGKIIKKILAKNPKAKILIVSATPYRLSGEGFEYIVPDIKTKLIVNSTLKTGIEQGWATPLDYYIASMPDLGEANKHLSKGDYEEALVLKAMEMAPLVQSYKDHGQDQQGIIFAINVQHSLDIVQQYRAAGYTIEHLDAETPADERKRILSNFKRGLIRLISNVGILTEGSDFPNCVVIQLARPSKSLSLIWQMIGRNTRPADEIVQMLNSLPTAELRRKLIAESIKPFGIVLDNCSAFLEHGMPDEDQDWERHFRGTRAMKREKKENDEQMEMLIYVVEDAEGNRRSVNNVKEIEGMKLIKVTREVRSKIVNLKSLHHFDKLYAQFRRMGGVNKPGYVAFSQYMDYCKKENFLVVPEVWDYLERKLIFEIDIKIAQMESNFKRFPDTYPLAMFERGKKAAKLEGVSKDFFRDKRQDYARDNADQLAKYLVTQNHGNVAKAVEQMDIVLPPTKAVTNLRKSLFDLGNI